MDKYQQSKRYFDEISGSYAERIQAIQPAFYKNAAAYINAGLGGCKTVLDIGNGGVINYDFSGITRLDCADLSLSQTIIERYANHENVSFFISDILRLNEIDSSTYDAVIVQTVLHHLAGDTRMQTNKNVLCALASCMRVLKPGGKLLIVESVVTAPFEILERLLYPLMQLFFKLCRFGAVYQYSERSLRRLIQDGGYSLAEYAPVALDRHVWIMGCKVLTALTPCRAVWACIEKGL